MDPLSSVKEFVEQEGSSARVVRIAPPPILPMAGQAATGPAVDEVDLDDTGELDLGNLHDAGAGTDEGAGEEQPARGWARGRKRVVQVYLPAPTQALLVAACEVHGTWGKAAMAALRGSYQWLVDTFTPEPVEPIGPFPAPRTTRRRLSVDNARTRQLLIDPAEAAGIATLADQLDMSLSELVTLAVDRFYADTPADPPVTSGRSRRASR